jgi:uncharacterized membrane protein YkoI
MSMSLRLRKGLMTVAALGALALGGSALANAATSGSNSSSGSAAANTAYGAQGSAPAQRDPTVPGGHRGANGQTEAALPSDVAAKVKAAAEAKVSGGTVERVETDVDHGSPYEAHVRKADGTELEVLVDKGFNVTAINTMQHP